jgi:hypothetical protein
MTSRGVPIADDLCVDAYLQTLPDCGDDVTAPGPRPHRSGGDCERQRRHVANNGGHGTDEDHVRFVRSVAKDGGAGSRRSSSLQGTTTP